MCRLISLPSKTKRDEAIEIMRNFEKGNTDGVGYSFVKDGKFYVRKWPTSLSKVLARNSKTFLEHMDGKQDGWTIAHVRAGTHGENLMENTHPFIVGPWAIVHNGVWSDYKIAKLCLSNSITLNGATDSEVASNVINLIGPRKFAENINYGGVYLCLNLDGTLWLLRTSGSVEIHQTEQKQTLIASEFPDGYKSIGAGEGWYHFAKDGTYIKHKHKEKVFHNGGNSNYYARWGGESRTFGRSSMQGITRHSHWSFGEE